MTRALLLVDLQNDYFPGGKMELVGIRQAAAQVHGAFRAALSPLYAKVVSRQEFLRGL